MEMYKGGLQHKITMDYNSFIALCAAAHDIIFLCAVSDLQCSFSSQGGGRDAISARLRKPAGFRGSPLFADDRNVDAATDPHCQIRLDPNDPTDMTYNMLVTDFSRCGVVKRNGAVHLRLWFPQFVGVIMLADQELILIASGARVSGVVEEKPGTLEYEVALYKEAMSRNKTAHAQTGPPAAAAAAALQGGEIPVEQAVQIGTKLQLRARINPHSAWKYVKLMEVTVSPDPDNPHTQGHVYLVKDGCRNRDLSTIIPHQPARYRERTNEVFLDFEAFLLSTMQERSTLWIHSEIKACMDAADCQPEFCLDLFEPSGHGRRRREATDNTTEDATITIQQRQSRRLSGPGGSTNNATGSETSAPGSSNEQHFTKFGDNIAYTVVMKETECLESSRGGEEGCGAFLGVATVLGGLLAVAVLMACYLSSRLSAAARARQAPSFEELVRQHKIKYSGPEAGGRSNYHCSSETATH
ncbi:hypothetical protein B566_EDAN014079 [Ephemera danica]|nr:hypothetical protein B566_EDAN014079 [Ephemera danica]